MNRTDWQKLIDSLPIILCLALFGCGGHPTITSKTPLGKIVDSEVVSTSFIHPVMLRVKTEKAVVILKDMASVDLGKEAFSVQWSDGTRTFEWDGGNRKYRY